MANESRTHYDELEINPRARGSVVTAAYRAIAKEIHPDITATTGGRFRKIQSAYDILSDPDRRSAYDLQLEQPIGKTIGNYRLVRQIAEGGFGRTYEGRHILADEPVCIKHCSRISAEDDAILIGEAKAAWDLRHYSLPAMRDLIRLPDRSLALVMSYIPGPTLEQAVQKVGKLDPEHVAWIAERTLNALMYMHYNQVVHGDVKPQNIIIQPESHQIALVDFGLSAVKPTSRTDNKGYTPLFAPPEQLDPKNPIIPESDFYSLGMTMIYALTGSLDRVKNRQIPVSVPDPLAKFIGELTRPDVLDRPRWEEVDLCVKMQEVRRQSFGRGQSGMKPIIGLA